MHDPNCQPDSLCGECEIYDVSMEPHRDTTPGQAFHAHLHEVIRNAKLAGPEENTKKPVRSKFANFLVAYYDGDEVKVEGTIEGDSALEALELQAELERGGTKAQIFIRQAVLAKLDICLIPKNYLP